MNWSDFFIFLGLVLAVYLLGMAFGFHEGNRRRKHKGKRFNLKFGAVKSKVRGFNMVEVTITNEQKIEAKLAPVTETGTPATLDGKPTWTVVSGDSTVEVAEDGFSAFLISSDNPGDTVFMVEADTDLGAGVETISDTIKLSVEGARAKNLGLTLGAPVAK